MSEQSTESTASVPQPLSDDELEQAHGGDGGISGGSSDPGWSQQANQMLLPSPSEVERGPSTPQSVPHFTGVDPDTVAAVIENYSDDGMAAQA
ncbi:MAG: hypothetical protein F4091_12390 [Acidimicrobiales bacterium]|nr:hypothetical protein [Acidimicrobiales bacterium]MYD82212.1 hypothetical protein [Acidimicrobiales bacterium]MYJ66242.1 hypothetical protein [Acidimicrobiales bacterium]